MDENEIETLKAEIAAKDAIIQEMKTAADAQHAEAEKLGKLAEEAATAGKQAAEALEQAKQEFAAQLAAKDADLADWERRYTEMRGEFEARNAERDTLAANLRAELEAAHAGATANLKARIAELEASHAGATANLKARIAELEANAKTAEQIAAEKYGAALPAGGTPAGQIDIDALRAQYESVKANPVARVKFIRELPQAQFNALFK